MTDFYLLITVVGLKFREIKSRHCLIHIKQNRDFVDKFAEFAQELFIHHIPISSMRSSV